MTTYSLTILFRTVAGHLDSGSRSDFDIQNMQPDIIALGISNRSRVKSGGHFRKCKEHPDPERSCRCSLPPAAAAVLHEYGAADVDLAGDFGTHLNRLVCYCRRVVPSIESRQWRPASHLWVKLGRSILKIEAQKV
jgi:hypothetical protein